MARKPTKDEHSLDFEATLTQLESIVARLESGELPLEQALQDFENGIKLAQLGQARLQQAEQRIQILLSKSDKAELSNYQHNE
ncbi:exodeoxyribonuclease VII small subunit [Avibacterium sp. 21-599]|uniref:exodeoxyribonuclease VII small subunit n=1 Tax=Avibacterium sp. 21-599 TaxID=2911528 RepID=UPI0022461BE2|nr:exodeoxyribonuclease VII small subunit [Avibacterium sp. 21-599]MCW9718197.1 exodeoxyribonuclease VII small subunit [Avibacterium sp. 21-599]